MSDHRDPIDPFEHPLRIPFSAGAFGVLVDLPATWLVVDGVSAALVEYRIGGWVGDREAAVAMIGAECLVVQELAVFDALGCHSADPGRALHELNAVPVT